MAGEAAWRVTPAPAPVAAAAPDAPTIGVAELHQCVGDTLTAAFPDRLWLCGEVVGTPAVRSLTAAVGGIAGPGSPAVSGL